eukprot:gb/GFBE01021091.1/.p1 GENE.gb/GFBE01021091.1/~~gb/GFBE01021091.1/.p1  ORF type:complete len:134 (+),score=16.53 gb/GFBE01021091.1/:1-402(+)
MMAVRVVSLPAWLWACLLSFTLPPVLGKPEIAWEEDEHVYLLQLAASRVNTTALHYSQGIRRSIAFSALLNASSAQRADDASRSGMAPGPIAAWAVRHSVLLAAIVACGIWAGKLSIAWEAWRGSYSTERDRL